MKLYLNSYITKNIIMAHFVLKGRLFFFDRKDEEDTGCGCVFKLSYERILWRMPSLF